MVRRWISVSRFVLFIALGFIIQHYLTPSYEVMKGFSLDWALSVFLRNTALLFLIAGSLHLYLHSYKVQGDKFKFLKREMDTNNKVFKFNNQVYDNIFWSIVSGVTVWTIYEVLYLTGCAGGGCDGATDRLSISVFCLDLLLSFDTWCAFLLYSPPASPSIFVQARPHNAS